MPLIDENIFESNFGSSKGLKMRNLKLHYCKHSASELSGIKFLLLDPNENTKSSKYYAVTSTTLYDCDGSGNTKSMLELPANIVSAEYLALENDICLATDVGEVLIVNPTTLTQTEGTFCDVGIESMTWSPDQEVVAFITKTHNVVVMTCTYDVIAEHALVDDIDANEQFINVGWGKKETQFHGSEGKGAAKQTSNFKQPENAQELPQNVEVSWRADGAYFAVSYVSEHVGRMFKVFDKEGKLQFVSEKVNGLYPPVGWRPSGTWIAIPQLLPNKSTVALFEKNGLRHREIVLPFGLDVEPIINLKWSSDSDILSIHTRNIIDGIDKIYLYTIGNYHWYLKQTLNIPAEDKVAFFTWDTRIGEEKSLHIIYEYGKYFVYCWRFGIDKYHDSGTVGVIDGKKLLLTNFDKSVVPPPMCNNYLSIENNINYCIFISSNKFCLYDERQYLHFFEYDVMAQSFCNSFSLVPTTKELPLYDLRVITAIGPNFDRLIAAQPTANNSTQILLISLNWSDGVGDYAYKTLDTIQLNGIACALIEGDSILSEAYAQTLDGKIYHISIKPNKAMKKECMNLLKYEQVSSELEWYDTRNYEKTGLISLTNRQCLYIDAQRIADDVTSFCRTGNYLVFTKLCSLHFYHLVEQRLVAERKIERGGKLVTVIANDARTILQMPRGNLEAINPRVLSLDIIGNLLDNCQFDLAMDMLRKQRINLNIICDHNMFKFVKHMKAFLSQIKNTNWINLFLSDLQNEDFTKTMYASNYPPDSQQYPDNFNIENKVTFLCSELCKCMQEVKNELYCLPIITSYVKIGQLETALQLIWQQKQKEAIADGGAGDNKTSAEEMLKYLLYLVDVNDLYNVALGTYDFGLVVFVAQKSQKDPKEFLPFLNELKTHEPDYRHFKIDEHLKRYEKALENIAKCGAEKFEEALEFIKLHSLYKKALQCYKEQDVCFKEICLAFGDYLRASGRLENASILYERGGHLGQALLSAKNALDWQRVLVLAKKDNMDMASVALSLIPSLQENGKHDVAFELLKTYGQDFDAALSCLLKGKLFLRAIFEARMQGTNEADVKATILMYGTMLENTLQADSELFVSFKDRLLNIREQKAKQQLQDCDDYNQADIDELDLLSDTTSMRSSQYTASSRGTGKTFRSAKNRRKHERKLLSLKPGNPFEDIALIDALHNLIMKLVNQQQHIRDTCKALLELNEDQLAFQIQQQFKQLLKLIQDSLDSIWIPEIFTTQQFLTGPNIDYTQLQKEQRYALIDPQKRFKPQINLIDWEHEVLK